MLWIIRNMSQRRDLAGYINHLYMNYIYSHGDGSNHLARGWQVRRACRTKKPQTFKGRARGRDAQKKMEKEVSMRGGNSRVWCEGSKGRKCFKKEASSNMPVR